MRYSVISLLLLPLFFFSFLVACNPNNIDTAYSYYREGEYDKASVVYLAILKKQPNEVLALKGMGDIKTMQKDYSGAIEYYKKAIEIKPELAKKELVSLLSYSSLTVRTQAAAAIAELSNGLNIVLEEIVLQAEGSNIYSKADYIEALRRIGAKASSTVPEILKYFSNENSTVRKAAVEALSVMNINAIKEADGLSFMVKLMSDADPVVAETAVKCIGSLKSGAAEIIADVVKMLNNGNSVLVEAAKKSLESIGPGNADSVSGLVNLIGNKNPIVVRVSALDSLAGVGAQANNIVHEIIPMIQDDNNEIRIAPCML